MVFDGRCTRLADIFKCILIKQTIWNLIHAPVHLSKVIHGNEMKSSPLCSLLGNVLRDLRCNPVCWIGSIVVHFILTNIRRFCFFLTFEANVQMYTLSGYNFLSRTHVSCKSIVFVRSFVKRRRPSHKTGANFTIFCPGLFSEERGWVGGELMVAVAEPNGSLETPYF